MDTKTLVIIIIGMSIAPLVWILPSLSLITPARMGIAVSLVIASSAATFGLSAFLNFLVAKGMNEKWWLILYGLVTTALAILIWIYYGSGYATISLLTMDISLLIFLAAFFEK